ncbi:MAG: MBL fold metallo-hydrolase [Burkholderiales bacterium]|jgi:glyoxylase-like metal-dependent hydrolase (beta-lactamase superfamily II)|nr:MBL fold metallo-hydrolase [Burkholderiales bacterium]
MTDPVNSESRIGKPPLVYPFETVPATGEALQVAPGVMWMRMPMPMQLDHINLWALDDGDAWAVVDTGMRTDETLAAWRQLLAKGNDGRRVGRVFATHMHPDHVGMAGWLTRKFDCHLWMTKTEYLNCRVLTADTGREAPPDAIRFYRRAGWPEAAIEDYRARFGKFGQFIHALPDSYRRIRDGETVRIGAHDWQVVVGTGHSPEHACLYCPDLRILISGDQVLPRISSNVSVHPTEPDADPLNDWLTSIQKIRATVPDDVLVLPAHNEPFRGLHARLDYLAQGHHRSLARLLRTLDEPKRVIDVFGALFARAIDPADGSMQLGLASGESIANLNYLMNLGEVRREFDADGVAWYRRVSA